MFDLALRVRHIEALSLKSEAISGNAYVLPFKLRPVSYDDQSRRYKILLPVARVIDDIVVLSGMDGFPVLVPRDGGLGVGRASGFTHQKERLACARQRFEGASGKPIRTVIPHLVAVQHPWVVFHDQRELMVYHRVNEVVKVTHIHPRIILTHRLDEQTVAPILQTSIR